MPESDAPLFTIFTPTRDRAAVLHRVYESLSVQTVQNFEWLVIDNASSDGTPDLMARWSTAASFPVRYLYQAQNIGVQGSWARAVAEAQGELFLFARSADTFVPNALERFLHHWEAIPAAERLAFVGVTALAVDENGRLYGTPFPRQVTDSDSIEIRHRHRVTGEKWGFQRVEVLREHLPPIIAGYTGHMPESLMWRAIARRYRTRFVNEILRVNWADQSTSNSNPGDLIVKAPGRLLAAEDQLNHDIGWLAIDPISFLREAVAYVRSAWAVGRGPLRQVTALRPLAAKLLWAMAFPGATVIHVIDRLRHARAK